MAPLNFRAWLKDAKQMIEVGSLEFFTDASVHVNDEHPTPHVVVMQSTGLKDKNGVEIFEGDLVRIISKSGFHMFGENDGPTEVYWDDCCFAVKQIGGSASLYFYIKHPERYDVEVIGNIYQNPDLLPSPL